MAKVRTERVPYKTRALYENKEAWKALRQEFLDARDVTEYLFATNSKILDGGATGNKWKHWKMILKSPYCKYDVFEWREELEVLMRAEALRDIVVASKTEKGFQAAKFLIEKGWESKRGRPSKAEVEGEKRKQALIIDEVDNLFEAAHGSTSGALN